AANNTATDTDTIAGSSVQAGNVAVGADAGGPPTVLIVDPATGTVKSSILAYDSRFTGGVRVATADFNDDGVKDIVTAAGPGGGPHVKVFSGQDGTVLLSFFPYSERFAGGVYVAAGDVTGDGRADIVTGPGLGGGPIVTVTDGRTGFPVATFA